MRATLSRLRPIAVTEQAVLLGLVAVVTWVTATNAVYADWISMDAAVTDPRWNWLPAGGAVVVTLLRNRWPMVAVIGAGALFGWWLASGIALAVTSFEAAGRIRAGRPRIAVLAGAAAAGYAVSLLAARMPILLMTELHVISALACVALPAIARALLGKAERVLGALRDRTRHLEENYRLAHSAARLQERSRIAQEMHDQLGHRLSLIALYAGALELAEPATEASLIRSMAQTAMHELRTTLGLLHAADSGDPALLPVTEPGLHSDIARLVSESRSTGTAVTLTWNGDDLDGVATPVRRAVHRVVREGLTNVHRHAAGAAATVEVTHGPDTVRVTVANVKGPAKAPGLDPLSAEGGLGLIGVQERVRLLGGTFSAGPTPDGGFRMAATLAPDASPVSGSSLATVAPRGGEAEVPSLPFGRWAREGVSALLAACLVGVAALVIVAITYLPWYAPAGQSEPLPDQTPRIGMTRAEVLSRIGNDDPVARVAARLVETPPPTAGQCVYGTDWATETQVNVQRHCFRNGVLVSIDSFPVHGNEGPGR